ncbi:hypothetical protein ACNKU7_06190 [Microbulbifer sp. SA54]|uniref:hypothetical protein n=1 Tax=Microbulbifer sp. SA54 TaxID=3401577 RepID=UPI003AAC9C27
MYHKRRWDGDFLTVQKLTADGRLGYMRYFESHFDRFRPEMRKRYSSKSKSGTKNNLPVLNGATPMEIFSTQG